MLHEGKLPSYRNIGAWPVSQDIVLIHINVILERGEFCLSPKRRNKRPSL